MSSESTQEPQDLTSQKQYLKACFNLRAYDNQIERVCREVSQLFASQELHQRLLEKGRFLSH